MLEYLLSLFENYNQTCSIMNLKPKSVTFARNSGYLKYINDAHEDVWVIVPSDTATQPPFESIKYFKTEYPEYVFTLFHNYINKDTLDPNMIIGVNCKIHKTAVLGVEGLKVINAPDGSKISFSHTGSVVIEDNVDIGPYSVIHCGTIDSTLIRRGCKFGAYTNIGHNCDVGGNTVIAVGVILNGGVRVGEGCWFASGSLVRHHVNICSNVVVGLGAVVIKDITVPGIYVGNPAKFLKPVEEGWNF